MLMAIMQIKRHKRSWNCCTIKISKPFLENLDIPLINCEVSLALSWSASCVIASMKKKIVAAA